MEDHVSRTLFMAHKCFLTYFFSSKTSETSSLTKSGLRRRTILVTISKQPPTPEDGSKSRGGVSDESLKSPTFSMETFTSLGYLW